MGFFKNFINSIIKNSAPTFSFENNRLNFNLGDEEPFTFELQAYDMKTRHDPYTIEAYTIISKSIFLEKIRTDIDTSWRGSPSSLFQTFFKNELNIKKLDLIDTKDTQNFEFIIFEVDKQFFLYYIYIYEANKDVFIIDTKGDLFSSLCKKLNINFKHDYNLSSNGSVNFDISLVKNNSFGEYFKYGDN